MRGLRFYLGLGLAFVACTAVDVTFEDEPFQSVGGTGGTGGGTGGTGGSGGSPEGGFGGTLVTMAGQGGEEPGMAGQGGSEEPPEEGPCAMLDEGDACDDENPCTEDDICDADGACAGTDISCDDDNECTADSCGEDGECVNDPVEDGTPCGDDTVENCNGADICLEGVCDDAIGPDGAPCDDGDPQTGVDVCTGLVCEGVPACADGTVEEAFAGNMVGCAGVVSWPDRATLCGDGLTPCTDQQWVDRWGDVAPTHNYWTDTPLQYGGSASGNCIALRAGGVTCSDADSPMHVCGASTDAEGNTCQWVDCGHQSVTPNQYFGGCGIPNPTAGTLCCW